MNWSKIKKLRDMADSISELLESELEKKSTKSICPLCDTDIEAERDKMDIQVHDGTFWKIVIIWCPECKGLRSIEEF